ncbi:hypothetical protein MJO29_009725, partial [Puccinia striiformis f. sp. tritici]
DVQHTTVASPSDKPKLGNCRKEEESHTTLKIELAIYKADAKSVTQSSPYSQLSIDHHLMQCITKLKKLKNLYLSGIRLLSSTIQTGSKLLTSTLEILNLIAVYNSILTIIKSKDLERFADSDPNWSTLHHLSLKGLYGNPDIRLQASLGLLPLLEALKSHILISLKIILWLFQKIALKFPNLQDLQYPWAESLTSLKKLKKLKWNCSPFPLHDYIQIQAVIKSQVMILESRITTLIEQVLYLDISGPPQLIINSLPSLTEALIFKRRCCALKAPAPESVPTPKKAYASVSSPPLNLQGASRTPFQLAPLIDENWEQKAAC